MRSLCDWERGPLIVFVEEKHCLSHWRTTWGYLTVYALARWKHLAPQELVQRKAGSKSESLFHGRRQVSYLQGTLLKTPPSYPPGWVDKVGRNGETLPFKKQLMSLPQTKGLGPETWPTAAGARPCLEWQCPSWEEGGPAVIRSFWLWTKRRQEMLFFAQREAQMPILHLSPALWCGSLRVLLSFSQEPLSVLLRSLCPQQQRSAIAKDEHHKSPRRQFWGVTHPKSTDRSTLLSS